MTAALVLAVFLAVCLLAEAVCREYPHIEVLGDNGFKESKEEKR